jgi:hypothetical protein
MIYLKRSKFLIMIGFIVVMLYIQLLRHSKIRISSNRDTHSVSPNDSTIKAFSKLSLLMLLWWW